MSLCKNSRNKLKESLKNFNDSVKDARKSNFTNSSTHLKMEKNYVKLKDDILEHKRNCKV